MTGSRHISVSWIVAHTKGGCRASSERSYLDDLRLHSSHTLAVFLVPQNVCMQHALELGKALSDVILQLLLHLIICRRPVQIRCQSINYHCRSFEVRALQMQVSVTLTVLAGLRQPTRGLRRYKLMPIRCLLRPSRLCPWNAFCRTPAAPNSY